MALFKWYTITNQGQRYEIYATRRDAARKMLRRWLGNPYETVWIREAK